MAVPSVHLLKENKGGHLAECVFVGGARDEGAFNGGGADARLDHVLRDSVRRKRNTRERKHASLVKC